MGGGEERGCSLRLCAFTLQGQGHYPLKAKRGAAPAWHCSLGLQTGATASGANVWYTKHRNCQPSRMFTEYRGVQLSSIFKAILGEERRINSTPVLLSQVCKVRRRVQAGHPPPPHQNQMRELCAPALARIRKVKYHATRLP